MTIHVDMISIIILILIIAAGVWCSCLQLKNQNDLQDELEELRNQEPEIPPQDMIEYSNKLLDYIREFTMQVTVLKFQVFRDSHDVEKLTEGIIKGFVAEVAKEVYGYITRDKIDFTRTLFTSEFFDNYIISTVVSSTKSLIDKTIDGYYEE